MKNNHLFFQIDRCTGCQQCVNACSLARSGSCDQNSSLIKVPIHPEFGTSIPLIEADCLITECRGECVAFCPPKVLKLANQNQSIQLIINRKWKPVPVLLKGDF